MNPQEARSILYPVFKTQHVPVSPWCFHPASHSKNVDYPFFTSILSLIIPPNLCWALTPARLLEC